MGKLVGYFMFLIIVLLFFHITGFIEGTPNSNLLKLVVNPEKITDSSTTSLWTIISVAVSAAVVAGAAFGSAVMYRTNMVFKASITALLLTFIPDIIVLYNTLSNQINHWFAVIVCGPLVVISLIIIVEWWAGEG